MSEQYQYQYQHLIPAVLNLLDAVHVDEAVKKRVLLALKPTKRLMLKRAQVLEILGVSAPTLQKYIRSGKVRPHVMSARKIRFYADEIEALAQGVDR